MARLPDSNIHIYAAQPEHAFLDEWRNVAGPRWRVKRWESEDGSLMTVLCVRRVSVRAIRPLIRVCDTDTHGLFLPP